MSVIGTDFENWGPYLMKQFQLMYEKGERCDLEISCNKQIFLVHRLIMSACSEYVRELGDKQHIILPDEVSCKALKSIIEFVYSGKIEFNKDDKEDLLLASNLLNMRLLTELIKMEESCSFTLSMDDETEDGKTAETSLNAVIPDEDNLNLTDQPPYGQVSSQTGKRKSTEMKTSRPRLGKNAEFLPPLLKFPYLQQKFSASRTYGLITTLTDPVPSRFEISDPLLQSCGYRSTFEDVTYETEVLCSEAEKYATLEQAHIDFLKKMRESTSSNRRSYSNALYSPFDKYTPPYNINSELSTSRKREPAASYLSKSETVPPKSARKNQQKTPATQKRVTFAKEPQILTEKVHNSMNSTEIQNNICLDDIELDLPPPLIPVQNITSEALEAPSETSGEKIVLIKLNNAVVPIENDARLMPEELPDISISVVEEENQNQNQISSSDIKEEISGQETAVTDMIDSPELTKIDAVSVTETFVIPEVLPSTPEKSSNEQVIVPTQTEVSTLPDRIDEDAITVSPEASANATENSANTIASNPIPVSSDASANTTENSVNTSSSNTLSNILSNSSVFTAIDNKTISDLSPKPNSQMYALKVKGNENPDQLSKLVDLCKNNPLFKDKNVKFKIVPVRGPIPDSLKEQVRLPASVLNKAIIVKKTEVEKVENHKNSRSSVNPIKYTEKVPSIENVAGPWECRVCGIGETPSTFNSYFEYRTHLHDIHKEANNPMYCIHCGHKSVKRNMQLYHLFIKHNVKPPPNFSFPKCDKCEFYALNDYYMQKHTSTHQTVGMEYVCSCKEAFKTSELLQKHMVSNDCKNLKNFTCGYCRNIFDRFVNLKAHMRVCMKERSKPILQNSLELNTERNAKTVADG